VNSVLQTLHNRKAKGLKSIAVLLDPDKLKDSARLDRMMELIQHAEVDFVFVGGSLMVEDNFETCLKQIKANSPVPVVLFPGSPAQVSPHADAILFLSLISGRNPELLIGHHVAAAPVLQKLQLEIIPTGYMLVDCGKPTTASYISQTLPIPWNKPEIAAVTALAGQMLGLQCMYLDGGSGAEKPVSEKMIRAVRESIKTPLIVGGGIRTEQEAMNAYNAGADLLVVGTAFEEEPELLFSLSNCRSAGI
jgi:phosphoglycerol geranylgeranyltransferase